MHYKRNCLLSIPLILVSALFTAAIADTYTAESTEVDDAVEQDPDVSIEIGKSESFENIAANGLDSACYLDSEHYAAEFLYQNPDVCFWTVDEATGVVSELHIPEIPSDAIFLPAPTGRDDTSMLEAIINTSSDETYVGSGVYQVNNLKIKTPVTLYDMPMLPYNNAYVVVSIRSGPIFLDRARMT